MNYTIRLAALDDAEAIFKTMMTIYEHLEDQSLFYPDTRELITKHIKEQGITAVACDENDQIAGFFSIRFPGTAEDNLGTYLSLPPEEMLLVAHMESAAILPEHRGHKLQNRMFLFLEKELKNYPYKYYLTTISPHNPASLRSMMKEGFEIIATDIKYGGLERHILYRKA